MVTMERCISISSVCLWNSLDSETVKLSKSLHAFKRHGTESADVLLCNFGVYEVKFATVFWAEQLIFVLCE